MNSMKKNFYLPHKAILLRLAALACLVSSHLTSFAQISDTVHKNTLKPYIEGPMGLRVNSYTGNLYYTRNDLSLPAIGLPFNMTFCYNSSDATNKGFGHNWGWQMSMFYVFDFQSANVFIIRGDGRRDYYKRISSNAYEAPLLVNDSLY